MADSIQFVEYDQRAHRLETLANFAFWVQSRFLLPQPVHSTDTIRHLEKRPESQHSDSANGA
jgi:hypothetical protein